MPEVVDPNILAQLNGGQPAPAPAPVRQSSPPPFIPGTPKPPARPAPQTPDQAEKDRLDVIRANQAIAEKQRELDAGEQAKAIEAERKAAAFLIRGLGANEAYEGTGVGAPSWLGQTAYDIAPNAANYFMSSERQIANSAQDEFIAASLRQDSGAAIPEEELERQRRIYFPMPGEGPDVIEQKRQARLRALEGLKQSAGRLEQSAEERYNKLLGGLSTGQDGVTAGGYFTPEDRELQGKVTAAYKAGATLEQLQAITAEYGRSFPIGSQEALDRARREGRDVMVSPSGTVDMRGNNPDGDAPPPGGGQQADGGSFLGYDSVGQAARDFGMGVGDLVEGVGDTLGIVVNPVGQVIYNATGYGDQTYDLGQILRDSTGLPQSPDNIASSVNKFGAGALTGGTAARGIASLANPGTTQAVAQTIGRTPIRDTVAGAAAGAGSYAGRESGIPGGEIAGALAGGMVGYGGANALMNAFSPRELNAVAAAAGRQGVDLLPADVGGRTTQMVTSGTKASPLSAAPVVAQAQRNVEGLRDAATRVAQSQGEIVTTDIAGQNVREAAKTYSGMTSATGSRLYEQANEAAKGVKIKPLQTIAAIDEQLARLQQNPAATPAQITELQRFRSNIENGVSVTGLRDARTALSQGVYDGQLRSGVDQAMWKTLLGNLSSDITMGLEQAGRAKAARMFERADGYWKSRVETIDQVLQPIVGKDGMKGGEQVIQAIETMTRGGQGGSARLSRLLGAMSKEDAGQVRAVLIDRLGRANPGAQDAAGQAFSPATFLTNWNKMTPQAKASVFSDTKLRTDLNDLAKIAEGMKASRGMENFSNTSVAIGSNLGVGAALAYTNPTVALLGAGAQYMTGRLMASPGFARLLAKTAKLPPEQANRRFGEQLGVLAKSEPLIANDIKAVQQFLSEAMSQSPTRAAAEGQNENNRGSVPPQ